MQIIADLEVHSKYARAVSSQMTIPNIALWAAKKGIDLVGTGDFTHPLWFREIQANLEESGEGVYSLKGRAKFKKEPKFLLTSEVSSIFSQSNRVYRIHTMVFTPNLETVARINQELLRQGCNLMADGRPVIGLSCKQLAEIVLGIDSSCLLIPAHCWTPWFGFYGANGGFDSLEEGFGQFAKYIFAVETGMSSDPAMNWRIAELADRSIVSFGDAHSLTKLGREATVFELPELSYEMVRQAIVDRKWEGGGGNLDNDVGSEKSHVTHQNPASHTSPRISFTIEFYPEEGKYHLTGHRNCQVRHTLGETKKLGTVCPVCRKRLTVGVMHRVDELASQYAQVKIKQDKHGVSWMRHPEEKRPPYVMLVPLHEILAEVFGIGISSRKVTVEYEKLTENFGTELDVLLRKNPEEITRFGGPKLQEAIMRVRLGDIFIDPGYDGVFGKVKIWGRGDKDADRNTEQMGLF